MIILTRTISQILTAGLALFMLMSCGRNEPGPSLLILTEAPGALGTPDYLSGVSWRYMSGARISKLVPGKPGSLKVLTEDFHSAAFPHISYDGRSMLFAAMENEGEPWQIWEMNLRNGKYRKVVSSSDDCTDPSYLPGGRIVFSRRTLNDTVVNAHCVYMCNLDGSSLRQTTFSPVSYFANCVLKDGRVLSIATEIQPDMGKTMMAVMRPDGTKGDMLYRIPEGNNVISRACETKEGKIVFAEADNVGTGKNDIISISYNRPLHTRINLTSDLDGDFIFALPLLTGELLVSYRTGFGEPYGLFEFDPGQRSLGRQVYYDPEYNVIEVIAAEEYQRPKNLPSEVDLGVKTGLIMCQNINFRGLQPSLTSNGGLKASRIEVLGVDSTYGVVDVEEDGSFYLKVLADKPFRIRTLDNNGNVVGETCSWIWLRPNERRGCVGCHEDPELVPENRIPLAVRKDPAIIPVHITSIDEKSVELE